MADPDNKHPLNRPGAYYCDDTCIDCDLCREMAPQCFRRDDLSGATFVWQQPATEEELALAEAALHACPTESIGNDGQQDSFDHDSPQDAGRHRVAGKP